MAMTDEHGQLEGAFGEGQEQMMRRAGRFQQFAQEAGIPERHAAQQEQLLNAMNQRLDLGFDTSGQGDFRNRQLALLQQLEGQANVADPSVAEAALSRRLSQQEANIAAQMAASTGLDPAVAAQLGGQAVGAGVGSVAEQLASARAQEQASEDARQLAIRQAIAQQMTGVRGADIGVRGLEQQFQDATARQALGLTGLRNELTRSQLAQMGDLILGAGNQQVGIFGNRASEGLGTALLGAGTTAAAFGLASQGGGADGVSQNPTASNFDLRAHGLAPVTGA